ncbi:MAG: TonB-dependent receptor [Bacteroides sp.]|nr:TonB-dependent receptor [Bacteroides sp.]MCM1095220.1 TonB-dependent receptor [Terasakiella sp.]
MNNHLPYRPFKRLALAALALVAALAARAEIVTGSVTDSSAEPLPGVSVAVKGAAKGAAAVTDIDGRFSIDVPSLQSTLTFSYIGCLPEEIALRGRTTLTVVMRDNAEALGEVVVVGYGTQKKANLTGAVAAVGSEVLENRPGNSVAQMLQGALPNVNISVNTGSPGAGGNLNIRGQGSINSNSPLILIDGVPGSIDQLNPSDIESISALKDASSAAIYGARAAFGVILITTKKASEGKTRVSYTGYVSWSEPTVKTDFVTSGYEHALIYDTSYKSTGGSATGYTEADMAELEARRYDITEHPDRPWVVKDATGKYHYYANFDWWRWMYKDKAFGQSHNVAISGGNDRVQYYISGSYYSKDGFIRIADEQYRQYTLTSKINARLSSRLSISNNTSYFDRAHSYPGENASNAAFARTMINCAPYYVPVGPDGNYTGVMANGKILGEARFADIMGGVSKGSVGLRRFRNTFNARLDIIKGLSLNADYTFQFTMDDNWKRQGKVYVSSGSEDRTQLSSTTAHKTDYYQKSMSFNPSHFINAYASYEATFGGRHNVSAVAGINYEHQQTRDLLGYRSDVLSEELNDLNLAVGDEIKATGGAQAYELFGTFFRANYNYDNRYLVEFNGRYDGSSRFLSGNRYGFFPSASAAWRISEESFMRSLNWINNLKLRGSYGLLGNQLGVAMYPYSTMTQKLSTTWIVDNALVYYFSTPQPVSADYTWEKVRTLDLGLDFAVLGNRLQFSGDWFRRTTTDMFADGITVPDVFGTDPPRQNAGELLTTGYELSLSWHDAIALPLGRLTYEVRASLGDSRSKITKYSGNDSRVLTDYYVGQELGEIWGYRVAGLFASDEEAAAYPVDQHQVTRDIWTASGEWAVLRGGDMKYIDTDGSGAIDNGSNTVDDHGDLVKIGNSLPRWNYGFGASVSWLGIDIDVAFQGIGRYHMYPNQEMEKFWGSWGRVNSAFLPKGLAEQAWTPENTGAYFPRLERGSAAYKDKAQLRVVNDRYLQNLAYLRLKNLTVGYTLPAAISRKFYVEKLRVYFAGENLWYHSPFHTDYIDPEQAMSSSDARIYPFSRTYSVGLNITF